MNFRTTMMMTSVMALTIAGVGGCSSSSDDSGSSGSSGSSGGTTGTLYERLGKKAGIAAAVRAIVVDEVKDPNTASFFFNQTAATPAAGSPTLVQLEECFTLLLANAAGGPEKYPETVSGGFVCRDMKTSHAGLGIPDGEFDKFVTTAAGTLKRLGVADADITVVGGALNATKADVAQDKTRQTGPFIKK